MYCEDRRFKYIAFKDFNRYNEYIYLSRFNCNIYGLLKVKVVDIVCKFYSLEDELIEVKEVEV